ncbi:MAG: substrate-binding domain-containing protein [Desulfovibrionaceae bacterium]|nr:substrate-binding domain-containing protein [Desulfovibrionaceae bacterium]
MMKYRIIGFLVSLLMPGLVAALLSGGQKICGLASTPATHHGILLPLARSALEGSLMFATLFILPAALGRLAARHLALPKSCFSRYFPLLLPGMLWILGSIPFMYLPFPLSNLALPGIFLSLVYFLFFLGFALTARSRLPCLRLKTGLLQLAACLGAAILVAEINLWHVKSNLLIGNHNENSGLVIDVYDYFPFYGSKLARPDRTPPSLQIMDNHPRLDGDIGLLPVYAAAAQALYINVETGDYGEYLNRSSRELPHIRYLVDCNNTRIAWDLLVEGYIDIFFEAPPSQEQLRQAGEAGLEPEITPIAKDALVFMVYKDNPVDNLSIEQIQAIYRGEINNWEEVGGEDEKIFPFQRPEGSGSQTAMCEQVMDSLKMTDPLPEKHVVAGHVVKETAEFRDRAEALGYAFFWHAGKLFPSGHGRTKLLAVNGVKPYLGHITDNSYPLIIPLVAVTLRPRSPQTQALIDWLTGPEGQALIKNTGYVPLKSGS